jgi:hypothetical protein
MLENRNTIKEILEETGDISQDEFKIKVEEIIEFMRGWHISTVQAFIATLTCRFMTGFITAAAEDLPNTEERCLEMALTISIFINDLTKNIQCFPRELDELFSKFKGESDDNSTSH